MFVISTQVIKSYSNRRRYIPCVSKNQLKDETLLKKKSLTGADPGFQVRRGVLIKKRKSRRAEGGAKIVGVFRVKNHDFMRKNHIFSNFRGGGWIRPCISFVCGNM